MAKVEQEWLPLFKEFIKYLRINSKEEAETDERGSKLNLWRSQEMALNLLVKGMEDGAHTFMIGKSRQLGISTITEALDIFWLAYHPNMIGAYVCDVKENRAVIREKLTRFVSSFPSNFFGKKFSILKDNENYLLFSNGSRLDFLIAGKTKENWGEGRGYTFAHLTECSKYGSAAGIANFREALSETHPNRLFIFESTSKGVNHWKDMWDEFGRDIFGKRRIFIGWWGKNSNVISKKDPRYKVYGVADPDPKESELISKVHNDYGYKVTREQLAWYRYKHSDGSITDADMFQNQPWTIEQSFVVQGYSFFPTHQLLLDLERTSETPFRGYKYQIGSDFWGVICEEVTSLERIEEVTLRVWEEPDDDAVYSIGCDPAYGRSDDKDSHSIEVYRCFSNKLVQVAEWADNDPSTKSAAWVLAHLAGVYKNCIINVEAAPGPGGVIINELESLRDRMRVDPKFEKETDPNQRAKFDDFLFNARWYLYKKPDSFAPGFVKGWESNFRTKGQIMALYHDQYTMEKILINSKFLASEMLDVIRNGDKIEAPSPLHDDRVIGTALAIRAWRDDLELALTSQGATYEQYLATQNGEYIDHTATFINNVIKNFLSSKEEEFDYIEETDKEKWLNKKGFLK